MKIYQFFSRQAGKTVTALLLCTAAPYSYAVDEEELGGWNDNYIEQPDDWQELDADLPAYPQQKNLLDLGIDTEGMQFTVYLDEPSLLVGDDGVVRYTVVLVPPAGVWNVSNEGLRCGEKQFRRYAYGVDGRWKLMRNSPWRSVRNGGANRYRRTLYEKYFCNPMKTNQTARQMIDSVSENWHEM